MMEKRRQRNKETDTLTLKDSLNLDTIQKLQQAQRNLQKAEEQKKAAEVETEERGKKTARKE